MRKTQFLPKVCAAVVLLAVSIIILVPVLPVTLNRLFAGGIIDYGSAQATQYVENRPIDGPLVKIYGCLGVDGDVFENYYLATVNGQIYNKEKNNVFVLIKARGGTDISEQLNQFYRHNDGIAFSLSGVIRESNEEDKNAAEELLKQAKKKDAECIDYYIDCNKPISSYTTRTIFGLLLLAGAVFAGMLSWKAIKRNRDVDDMEYRRAMMLAEKERREKQGSADSADAIFGDADRSYVQENTQHQGSGMGQSPAEVARSLEQQSKENNYRPAQNQNKTYDDDGFFSSSANSAFQNANTPSGSDGFYGSGFYGSQNRQSSVNNDDEFYQSPSDNSDNKYDGFFGS